MFYRLLFGLLLACASPAQDMGAPVTFENKELFRIQTPIGPVSAESRAREIEERIHQIALGGRPVSISTKQFPEQQGIAVMAGAAPVLLVTRQDAAAAGITLEALTEQRAGIVQRAFADYAKAHSLRAYVMNTLRALLAWLAFALIVWLLVRGYSLVAGRVYAWFHRESINRMARGFSLVIWNRLAVSSLVLCKLLIALFVLFQFSFVLSYTFSQFPQTSGISTTFLDYLKSVIGGIGKSIIGYTPSGGVVIIVALLTHFLLKILSLLAQAAEHGDIAVPGIHPEMARPTYQLARILIVLFALVVVFPYLPGSQSDAFKGVSILVGVLISFGSGSSVGNILAGIVLTYMRPFRIGDRVEIAGSLGDVLEKSLLVTRLRTIKNVEVVIPNGAILQNQILNYSAMSRSRGLILHTTVTIGYNAPWRDVHQALIDAAMSTDGILPDPRPFILQTSLNDYHISYQLNAYTDRPNEFEVTYARLHQNIQDSFNKAGIEIMSPSYYALRDGNATTIPEAHLPPGYRVPGFRVQP